MKTKHVDGIVIINNIELKVSYKFVTTDELFCISLENKENYTVGQTFYTHYKSLKVN